MPVQPVRIVDQNRGQRFAAVHLDFAALDSELNLGRAAVAGDDLEAGSRIGVQRARIEGRRRRRLAGADHNLALACILERRDAGFRQRHSDVDHRGEAAEIVKLCRVDPQLLIDQRGHRQLLGDAAEVRAVLRRDLVQIFDRLEAAGSRHVHRDDGRVAGDVAAEKFGGEPAVEVVAAAGAVADDQRARSCRDRSLRQAGPTVRTSLPAAS